MPHIISKIELSEITQELSAIIFEQFALLKTDLRQQSCEFLAELKQISQEEQKEQQSTQNEPAELLKENQGVVIFKSKLKVDTQLSQEILDQESSKEIIFKQNYRKMKEITYGIRIPRTSAKITDSGMESTNLLHLQQLQQGKCDSYEVFFTAKHFLDKG